MAFDINHFRASFGALMAQVRGNLDEFDRAHIEMRRRIEAFCAH